MDERAERFDERTSGCENLAGELDFSRDGTDAKGGRRVATDKGGVRWRGLGDGPEAHPLFGVLDAGFLELAAEDGPEDDEEDDGGTEENHGVAEVDAHGPAAFLVAEVEVVFYGAEEDVDLRGATIVVLLGLGFGDEVGDLLVVVKLAGGDAVNAGAEVAFGGL